MSRVQQSNDHRLNNGENDHLWNGSYGMRVNQNLINSWSKLTTEEKLGVDWAVAWRPRGTSPGMPKVGQLSCRQSGQQDYVGVDGKLDIISLFTLTKIGGWRRQRWQAWQRQGPNLRCLQEPPPGVDQWLPQHWNDQIHEKDNWFAIWLKIQVCVERQMFWKSDLPVPSMIAVTVASALLDPLIKGFNVSSIFLPEWWMLTQLSRNSSCDQSVWSWRTKYFQNYMAPPQNELDTDHWQECQWIGWGRCSSWSRSCEWVRHGWIWLGTWCRFDCCCVR